MPDKETIQQRKECAMHFQKVDDAIMNTKDSVARIDVNLNNHITEIKTAIRDLGNDLRKTSDMVESKLDIQNAHIETEMKEIMRNTNETFATKKDLGLVQKIVFTMIGAILLAFLYAVINGVIK